MSEPASISSGIAQRYATAVFDLCVEGNSLADLEKDIATLNAALSESEDLGALITNPSYSRDEQQTAIAAISKKAGVSAVMTNTLALMAQNRRLFVMPALLRTLAAQLREHKGVVPVEVTSAKALTQKQSDALVKSIKDQIGKEIEIQATVDSDIIGGLVVKVGSKMVDTSIRSKLNSLQNAMKEVG